MRAELLTIADCPNAAAAHARLRAVLTEVGITAAIETIEIDTPDRARRLHFLGSPTIRIDGHDVEPAAERRRDYGLFCRVYETGRALVAGIPPTELIRAAVRRAVQVAEKGSA